MDVIIKVVIAAIIGLIIGGVAGYFGRKNISEAKIGEANTLAKNIVDQANKDAETIKKEKLLEAKEEIHRFRSDAEKENRERRNELQKYER
ncbi:MAG: Rnase Y domain-containing protein, partial [Intestinibacter sp.]